MRESAILIIPAVLFILSVRLPTSILFLNGDFQCNPEVPGKMGNVSFGYCFRTFVGCAASGRSG